MARRNRGRGLRPRDVRTARAQTRLRYRPEQRALDALVGQAKAEYQRDLRVATGAAATAVRSARQQRKPLRKIYRRAVRGVNVAERDVDAAYGRAGVGSADPFRLATESESGAYRQQLAAGAASAQRDLKRQANEARLGRVFAMAAATDRFREARGEIRGRRRELRGERGDFLTSQLNELRQARLNRPGRVTPALRYQAKQNRASQERSRQTQLDVAAAQQKGGGGGGGGGAGGGGKPASRSELRMFKTDFSKALRYAREYAGQNTKRSEAATSLIKGVKGAKGGPAVPSIDDQLALSAALDMAYDGHVSRRNAGLLRDAGMRVGDLPGAKSYKHWLRQTRRQQQKASRNTARQYSQGSMY